MQRWVRVGAQLTLLRSGGTGCKPGEGLSAMILAPSPGRYGVRPLPAGEVAGVKPVFIAIQKPTPAQSQNRG